MSPFFTLKSTHSSSAGQIPSHPFLQLSKIISSLSPLKDHFRYDPLKGNLPKHNNYMIFVCIFSVYVYHRIYLYSINNGRNYYFQYPLECFSTKTQQSEIFKCQLDGRKNVWWLLEKTITGLTPNYLYTNSKTNNYQF